MGLQRGSGETSESTERRPTIAVGAIVFKLTPSEMGEGGGGDQNERRVLLIRRARPPHAGRYSLPGGRVHWGEELQAALIREIREETGLEIRVGPLVEAVELIDTAFHYVVMDYLCACEGGDPKAGDDADDALFVKLSELDRYGVSDAVKRVIAKAGALDPPR